MKNETNELEDMLADLDPPYESVEELKIGRLLDQYGIPFFYKQPMVIYNEGKNEIWKPSFTLYSYGGLVIDYAPSPRKDQQDELLPKEQIYRYNQIPVVLLGPKDLMRPKWEEVLYERLEQVHPRHLEPADYQL